MSASAEVRIALDAQRPICDIRRLVFAMVAEYLFTKTIDMKRAFRTWVLSSACCLAASAAFVAGESAVRAEGWSLSKLNPFKSKAAPAEPTGEVEFDTVDFTEAEELSDEEINSARIEDPLEEESLAAPRGDRFGDDEAGGVDLSGDDSSSDRLGDESIFDDRGSAEEIARDQTKRPKPAKPSAWRRFTAGGKNLLTKTGEVLNPFDGKPKKKAPPKPLTGGRSYSGTRMSAKREEKPSFFSSMTSWMKPKEEPKEARTVTDFLGSPRPY